MVRYFYDALLINEIKIEDVFKILKEMKCNEVFFFVEFDESEARNDVLVKEKVKIAKDIIKSASKSNIRWEVGIFVKNLENFKIVSNLKRRFGNSVLIATDPKSFECLRKIVDSKAADIIIDPQKKRKDEGIDHIISKKMKEQNIGLLISLSNLFSLNGKKRSMEFGKIKEICKYYNKYSFPLLIASFVSDPILIRDPISRASLLRELSVKEDKILDTVSKNYSKIKIEENKKNFVVRRRK